MTEDFTFNIDQLSGKLSMPNIIKVNEIETDEQRKLRMLNSMSALVMSCSLCDLGRKSCIEHRSEFDPHVFSTRNVSRWLIVGQNPGYNECLKHEPFVGDAGRLFDEQLVRNGLHRSRFYISNVVKCHTIANELPNPEQTSICSMFLKMEILLLNPVLVVTLGAAPFGALCPNLVYSTSLGQIHDSAEFNCKVFPIYHPSPRNMSNVDRLVRFKQDMKKLCKLIKAFESTESSD
jgi:uracil-DNA glycosylase family 4